MSLKGMVASSRLALYLPGFSREYVRWTPHPVIVTIRDNRDYIRVLLYSYYTTITGWGVLLRNMWVYDYYIANIFPYALLSRRSIYGLRGLVQGVRCWGIGVFAT